MWNRYSCNTFPHAFSDFQLRMPTLVWVFYHHLLSSLAIFNSNDCLGQRAMPFWKVLSWYLRWHVCLEQSDTGTPVWIFLSWFLRSHDFSKSQSCSTLTVGVSNLIVGLFTLAAGVFTLTVRADWSLHSSLRRRSISFSLFTSGLTSTEEFDCDALSIFRSAQSLFFSFVLLLFLRCLCNVCMSGLKIYIYFYFPLILNLQI